ncbi:GAF domain-containing protein [Bdellovibrio sp. HCB185ZH]|uniref:GAF domain-containing protein n=1 Tax=Bdellovibrio sp. HCB185ZH TaxID=3394235 RepID=UPI0039A6DF1D
MEASTVRISYQDKVKFYKEIHSEALGLAEREWFVNLANFSALLNQHLPEINWVGFYLNHGGELLLSSFQGLPACTRIAMGKGVCGTAAQSLQTQLVPDVHLFPGHIACDARSRSEVVIPLVLGDRLLGVLDIDSPLMNRFDQADVAGLSELCKILIEKTVWPATFA